MSMPRCQPKRGCRSRKPARSTCSGDPLALCSRTAIARARLAGPKQAAQCFTETWNVRSTTILGSPKNCTACIFSMGPNCFVITIEHGARNSSTRRSISASPSLVCPSRRSYTVLADTAVCVPFLLTQLSQFSAVLNGLQSASSPEPVIRVIPSFVNLLRLWLHLPRI